ncbi:MAG: glycosyltransferase family 4 protein [Candidatus Methanosuratincola petrocarbonis]
MSSKILVISERFWPEGSGGELATKLIIAILKDFFDITVVTGTSKPEIYRDVRYIHTDLLQARGKQNLWINNLLLSRSAWFKNLLIESDVVYIPGFSLPLIELAKNYGKKVVVHLHGYVPICYTATLLSTAERHLESVTMDDISLELSKSLLHGLAASTFQWMPKLARDWISKADEVICVSRRQAEIISKVAPKIAKKISVVYCPLPRLSSTEEKLQKPTFVYAGGESYIKGFHLLLRTMPIILSNYKNVSFSIAGKLSDRTIRIFEKLNGIYGKRVVYLGRLPHEEMLKTYSRSWASIFPSICEETFGYVVLDSMACGTIPIASRVGGVPEIVEGSYAEKMLFEPNNFNEFIEKVENVLDINYDDLNYLGHSLADFSKKKFNSYQIKKQLIKIFFENK